MSARVLRAGSRSRVFASGLATPGDGSLCGGARASRTAIAAAICMGADRTLTQHGGAAGVGSRTGPNSIPSAAITSPCVKKSFACRENRLPSPDPPDMMTDIPLPSDRCHDADPPTLPGRVRRRRGRLYRQHFGRCCPGGRAQRPAIQTRPGDLQHRRELGPADPAEGVQGRRHRRGRVPDDAQARRRADADGRPAQGRAEAVRRRRRRVLGLRQHLRVPSSPTRRR